MIPIENNQHTIIVPPEQESERIDRFIASQFSDISRTHAQRLLSDQHILVNKKTVRSSYKVEPDDVVEVTIPAPVETDIQGEDIDLDIIYEDDALLIVNKPAGMVVHPAPGHYDGTLVNALIFHRGDRLSGIGGVAKPGIVHRLDKETSGLLMVAKNDQAHQHLSDQLKARTLTREYHALIWGLLDEPEGTIDAPLGRHNTDRKRMMVNSKSRQRDAVTHYKLLEYLPQCCYVRASLETGRTHQIRVHFQHIHYPVVGDPTYGGRDTYVSGIMPDRRPFVNRILKIVNHQALHAKRIAFIHPITNKEMSFDSDLPEDFNKALAFLRKHAEK